MLPNRGADFDLSNPPARWCVSLTPRPRLEKSAKTYLLMTYLHVLVFLRFSANIIDVMLHCFQIAEVFACAAACRRKNIQPALVEHSVSSGRTFCQSSSTRQRSIRPIKTRRARAGHVTCELIKPVQPTLIIRSSSGHPEAH